MKNSKNRDEENKVGEPDLSGTYTAADFLSWRVDELMELIRGKVYRMSPAPTSWHQRIFSDLYAQMLKATPLGKGCRIWQAPLDVYLIKPGEDYKKTENVVEPDLFILCDPGKMHKRGLFGVPDFVVEILSPGTRKKDAKEKFELYEEYGVREYWMISVSERLVFMNRLNDDGKYQPQKPAVEGQVITPRDFPSIQVSLTELFKEIPYRL